MPKCLYSMFHLKPARLHDEIKKGFLIARAQNCIDFNIFYKSVHLVYEKLDETKSLLDFTVQVSRF